MASALRFVSRVFRKAQKLVKTNMNNTKICANRKPMEIPTGLKIISVKSTENVSQKGNFRLWFHSSWPDLRTHCCSYTVVSLLRPSPLLLNPLKCPALAPRQTLCGRFGSPSIQKIDRMVSLSVFSGLMFCQTSDSSGSRTSRGQCKGCPLLAMTCCQPKHQMGVVRWEN